MKKITKDNYRNIAPLCVILKYPISENEEIVFDIQNTNKNKYEKYMYLEKDFFGDIILSNKMVTDNYKDAITLKPQEFTNGKWWIK